MSKAGRKRRTGTKLFIHSVWFPTAQFASQMRLHEFSVVRIVCDQKPQFSQADVVDGVTRLVGEWLIPSVFDIRLVFSEMRVSRVQPVSPMYIFSRSDRIIEIGIDSLYFLSSAHSPPPFPFWIRPNTVYLVE